MIGANIQEDISKLTKTNSPRLQLDLNKIRQKELANYLLNYPLKEFSIFERHLNEMAKEKKREKITAKKNTIKKKKKIL